MPRGRFQNRHVGLGGIAKSFLEWVRRELAKAATGRAERDHRARRLSLFRIPFMHVARRRALKLFFDRLTRWLSAFLLVLVVSAGSTFAQRTLPSVDLKAEALPDFQVRLTWATPRSDVEFEIARQRSDGIGPFEVVPIPWRSGVPGFGPAEGPEQSYVDRDVSPLTTYLYKIRRPGETDGWEQAKVELLGNEVVVRGRKSLAELDVRSRPVHRLWLQAGSELITNGDDLDLRLVELRADGATIISFVGDIVAPTFRKGLDGGLIRLIAERALGTQLVIIGRGTKGGKGEDVTTEKVKNSLLIDCTLFPGHENGAPGGASSRVEIKITEAAVLKVDAEVSPGPGGDPGSKCGPGGKIESRRQRSCRRWIELLHSHWV
jgi:hypothetical protein